VIARHPSDVGSNGAPPVMSLSRMRPASSTANLADAASAIRHHIWPGATWVMFRARMVVLIDPTDWVACIGSTINFFIFETGFSLKGLARHVSG
jgi:hypothetical protein